MNIDLGDASIGAGLTALGGALVAWVRSKHGSRDRETGMVPQLLERIDRQDARLDTLRDELTATDRRCEEIREADRVEHEKQRQADREECEAHTEKRVRDAVDCVTRETTRQLHALLDILDRSPSVTDSMSAEIEGIRRRSLTPPGGYELPHPEDDGA